MKSGYHEILKDTDEGSGNLHFGLTAEALYLPHESLPWNPLIARIFYRRGIIESWGRGTLKIIELTQQAGLPKPEIEDIGGCVTVRLRPSRYLPPQRVAHDLTEEQQRILALLESSSEGMALRDIRQHLRSRRQEWETKDDLAMLKHLGLVEVRGRGRGAYWYFVNQAGGE